MTEFSPSFEQFNLEKRLEILQFAIDASNNCITISDPNLDDNPLIYVNKGFSVLTGYLAHEVLGRNCRFLQAGDHEQPELHKLREAIQLGKDTNVRLRNYRKDGSLFWNELYLSAIKDENGKVLFFMGVQNDVSQRVKLEQGLRDAVEASLRDATWLTQAILDRLSKVQAGESPDTMPAFTDREFVVLELLAKGMTNLDIAKELDLSVHTVRNYIASLYGKLGLNNRVQVVIWAHERGIGLS